MGVRLYNATRGLFTALDPVPGGNDTAYNYPNDPINSLDLDGQRAMVPECLELDEASRQGRCERR